MGRGISVCPKLHLNINFARDEPWWRWWWTKTNNLRLLGGVSQRENALICIIMKCAEIEKFQLLIGCVRKWRLNAYRPMMVIRARRRSNAPVSDINSRVVVVDSCILQTEMDWMVGETNQRSGHHHIYLYVTSLSITKRELLTDEVKFYWLTNMYSTFSLSTVFSFSIFSQGGPKTEQYLATFGGCFWQQIVRVF